MIFHWIWHSQMEQEFFHVFLRFFLVFSALIEEISFFGIYDVRDTCPTSILIESYLV